MITSCSTRAGSAESRPGTILPTAATLTWNGWGTDAPMRCRSVLPRSNGYRLLFKKSKTGCYATIEQDANESVPAVVWLLSEFDELLLDRYEGCPRYYYKKQFQLPVWNLDGHRMKKLKTCMAYILHEDRQLGCPSHEYFDLLADGYTEWGFPTDTLHSGLSSSIGKAAAVEFLKEID